MNFQDNIDRNLKVGPSCIHMNFSGMYEGKKTLYLALAFTSLDFLYDKHSFTEFINPKPAKDYISAENELIIVKDVNSKYIMDLEKYLEKFSRSIYDPFRSVVEVDNGTPLEELKDNYLDKGFPVMYVCDHYYTYEDYKKQTNLTHFHTPGHMAILCDIDFEKNTAYVIDKFYSFKGSMSLDNLKKSISSEHLTMKKFWIMNFNFKENLNEKEEFLKYFKINIQETLKDKVIIGNTEYYKNYKAVKAFVNDFREIVENLYDQKGKYAPQFLSKLISNVILQRRGYCNLLKYFIKMYDDNRYKKIYEYAEESKRLWNQIDIYNDKFFLAGKSIVEVMSKYEKLLETLLDVEGKLYQSYKEL